MYEYCTTKSAGNFIFFFLIFSLLLNFPRENGTIFTTWSIHEYSKYNKTTGKEACIMRDYIISCCSTADLTEEHFKARDISYICFHFELDGREYADDLGKSIPFDKFYAAMAAGADTKTSQVNAEEFEEYFEPFAEKHRLNVHHWFFSTDLKFYVKGGRISKTAGAIGGVLNICPLLNMDNLGRLIPRYKIRTKRKVIRAIVDKMAEYADHQTDYTGKCYISHSGCYEDAKAVADLVQSRFPYLKEKVEINNVGTTIGSHTGPGTVALFFWGDTRTE